MRIEASTFFYKKLLTLSLAVLGALYSDYLNAQAAPDERPLYILKSNVVSPIINYYSEFGVEYALAPQTSISAFVGYVGWGLSPRSLGQPQSDEISDGATVRTRYESSARGPFLSASIRRYLGNGSGLSEGYEKKVLTGIYFQPQMSIGHLKVEQRSWTNDFNGPDLVRYESLNSVYSSLIMSIGSQSIAGPIVFDVDVSGGIGYSSEGQLAIAYFSPLLEERQWSPQFNIRFRLGWLHRSVRKNQK